MLHIFTHSHTVTFFHLKHVASIRESVVSPKRSFPWMSEDIHSPVNWSIYGGSQTSSERDDKSG